MSFHQGLHVDMLEMMVEGFDPSKRLPQRVPVFRKERKRLMNSNSWVVQLYSFEVDR